MNRYSFPIASACLIINLNCIGAVFSWGFKSGDLTDASSTMSGGVTPGVTEIQLIDAVEYPNGIGQITVSMDHTRAQDLTLSLYSPDSSLQFTLFTGSSLIPADGRETVNFGGTYTFVQSGPSLSTAAGTAFASGGTDGVIPSGTYQAESWTQVGNFNAGDWTLRIVDSGVGETGRISEIQIIAVPEPLECTLLASLGLIGFAVYRRFAVSS